MVVDLGATAKVTIAAKTCRKFILLFINTNNLGPMITMDFHAAV